MALVELRLTCHVHQCRCPQGDAPAFMHTRLVTSLTGNQPYYIRGGLMPHLTKKGYFWKSLAPAIHQAVLRYRLHIDAVNSAYLEKMDNIDCGWVAPLPRVHQFDGATGSYLTWSYCAVKRCEIGLNRTLLLRQRLHPQCNSAQRTHSAL